MKIMHHRKIRMILSLLLMVLILCNQSVPDAKAAAEPKLKAAKVELVGEGKTYQMTVLNQVAGSTYKWSTSDSKVAKVNGKGLITAVTSGKADIKCKITYKNKKTKTLTCKVTVTIPASLVKINNSVDVKGAHVMTVNSSYDFNNDIVPANSTDNVYWYLRDEDKDYVRLDDSSTGKVTALKPGKAVLTVAAAKPGATMDQVMKSEIKNAIIIEVQEPVAEVLSADITNSTELKVVFGSAVKKETVVNADNTLVADSIQITRKKNVKNVLAQDPGNLKAELSADNKVLTITSTNSFTGDYGINFTNYIKTTDGIAIVPYYKQLTFIDNIPPAILGGAVLDDSGLIATISFSEPIDFSKFSVPKAQVISAASADQKTISILTNRLNYIPSADKKSMYINLSTIATTDFGKMFLVTFAGIKDMAGNTPKDYTLTTTIMADNTPKPQAVPMYITRTSYNTLTATFNRAIQPNAPGYLSVNNTGNAQGSVDANDNKKVNYTISDAQAALTGVQTVSIGFFNSYNVSATDTSANTMRTMGVDFSYDKTSPMMLKYEYDQDKNVLTLYYNKEVQLIANSGILGATLVTITDERMSNINITYTKLASTDDKIIKLQLSNLSAIGNYTFTLPQSMVMDKFRNYSPAGITLTVNNATGSDMELPGPYAVTQSTTDLSKVILKFANKLDIVSAETVSNYTIPGVTIVGAQVTDNTADNGATVMLTILEGSIDVSVARPIAITGVKGYNGSYSEMTTYSGMVDLKDNKKPTFLNAVFDKSTRMKVTLNFSEEVQGTLVVRVTQIGGTYSYEIPNSVVFDGNRAIINLQSIPTNNSYLRIEIVSYNITDTSGNQAVLQAGTIGGVLAAY